MFFGGRGTHIGGWELIYSISHRGVGVYSRLMLVRGQWAPVRMNTVTLFLSFSLLGKSVDMMEWFNRMTLEVILSAAFGIQSDVQTNNNSEMLDNSKAIVQRPLTLLQLVFSLPFAGTIAKIMASISGGPGFFIDTASKIIRMRREQAEKGIVGRKDLIHLMLTAHEETGSQGKGSKLTDDEIVAQSVVFLIAGQETSANTLAFTAYLLAIHPDIQEKLRSEIEDVIQVRNYVRQKSKLNFCCC